MGQLDWTAPTNNLDTNTVARAVSAGVARPNGGGSFLYEFNSLVSIPAGGSSMLYYSRAASSFIPMAKGGQMSGAMQRGSGAGATDFAAFIAVLMQSTDVNANAYLLGLSDSNPAHFILRKGKPVEGLPDLAPGSSGVLRRSDSTVAIAAWVHLRLDVVVNPGSDTVLKVFQNDLNANPVTAPVWVAIPGMADFYDDPVGVNSGSLPYTSGYVGFGGHWKGISRRVYFDHMKAARQL